MSLIKQKELSLPLGVIVEKRASSHAWQDHIWLPIAVFQTDDLNADWKVMMEGEGFTRYHAATAYLNLHRKETDALNLNLEGEGEIYVVLSEDESENAKMPYKVHLVTASSYEAQDYLDTGEDIIEKVPMPEPIAALIAAFANEHHVEEKFIKRKRDKLDLKEHKFGKQPIFKRD